MSNHATLSPQPIDEATAREFLWHGRIAVVGASDDSKQFAHSVFREMCLHGADVVPVNPNYETVNGRPCFADLASVPGSVDGVIVMVNPHAAEQVVQQCIELGIGRIWLFKGIGAPGAVSDETISLCRQHATVTIEGACPLMFLQPATWIHRVHRSARRARGAVVRASAD